jgi:hypothetical protein
MIETAFAIQVAVRDAVYSQEVTSIASTIAKQYQNLTQEEMISLLASLLSEATSMASFLTAEVCLGEQGMEELSQTIAMLSEMGNE